MLLPEELVPEPSLKSHSIVFRSHEGFFSSLGPALDMRFISPGSDGAPGIHRELEVQAGDVVRFAFDPRIPLQHPFTEYTINGYELSYNYGSGCSELSLNARAGLEPDEADPGPAVGVTASLEEAAPGDSVEIDLHLLFGNGTTRDFPAWQRFDVEITGGQEQGELVADGGAQTGTSLSQVSGEIEFIAHDDEDAFGAVEITVTTLLEADVDLIIGSLPGEVLLMQGGVQQQGIYLEGKVEINVGEEELTLELEITGENEIWPTIPRDRVPSVFRNNLSNLVRDTTDLRVRVELDGEPAAGRPVEISVVWIPETGGHNHNGASALKSPPEELMGRFTNLSNSETATGKITAVTDSTGIILLRYKASEFGGEVNLKAQVTLGEKTIESMEQLTKEVPNLELLSEGDHYRKVGGVPNHHGPRLDNLFTSSRTPDNNHYGTQAFVDSLISLANAWHELVTNDETMDDRQTPLNINDMSLPNGGLFDIRGQWEPAHQYHRLGRDADIRTTRSFPIVPPERNGVLLSLLLDANGNPVLDANENKVYRNREFERLVEEKGGNPSPRIHSPNTNNEHYHIYFYTNN